MWSVYCIIFLPVCISVIYRLEETPVAALPYRRSSVTEALPRASGCLLGQFLRPLANASCKTSSSQTADLDSAGHHHCHRHCYQHKQWTCWFFDCAQIQIPNLKCDRASVQLVTFCHNISLQVCLRHWGDGLGEACHSKSMAHYRSRN